MRRFLALLIIMSLLLVSCGTTPAPSDDNDGKAPADDTVPPEPVKPDDPDDGPAPDEQPSPDVPDEKPEPVIPDDQPEPITPDEEPEDTRTYTELLLSQMTLEEKVGQLFLIRPDSLDPSLTPDQVHETSLYGRTEASSSMLETLKKYPAGGIVYFGKNLIGPNSLKNYMSSLSSVSDIPLLYAVDEEGGIVSRIAQIDAFGIENVGYMTNIGATGDTGKAYDAGKYIGGYLSSLGIKLDFAPVADINTNPNNIVIGKRAFGSDPALVSSMVGSFLDGLHSEGTIGCTKHFPGHGDTSADTHEDYVSVLKTWDQLKEAELIPFVENFETTDMIMIAHLTLPKITSDGLPASLSKELVTGKLRGELGYEGLITTDALAMGAIAKNYSSAEAAVLAFDAGIDILLMPFDYIEAFDGVVDAVKNGKISESRLEESVLRILNLKYQYGLLPEN